VTSHVLLQFGGRKWLRFMKRRHAELRDATVKRPLEPERRVKVRESTRGSRRIDAPRDIRYRYHCIVVNVNFDDDDDDDASDACVALNAACVAPNAVVS
jgi:hypothetical protein